MEHGRLGVRGGWSSTGRERDETPIRVVRSKRLPAVWKTGLRVGRVAQNGFGDRAEKSNRNRISSHKTHVRDCTWNGGGRGHPRMP